MSGEGKGTGRGSMVAGPVVNPGEGPDSEDIDNDEGPDDGGAAPCTPGGTPEPRGPPPPQCVQSVQRIALRAAGALTQAFAEDGTTVNEMLVLVPFDYRSMGDMLVRIEPLRGDFRLHPNLLVSNVTDAEDEVPDTAGAPSGTTPSGTSTGMASTSMTPWSLTSSMASGSSGVGQAIAVSPNTPPLRPTSKAGANAPWRRRRQTTSGEASQPSNKKLEPHLIRVRFCIFFACKSDQWVCLCPGTDAPIDLSRTLKIPPPSLGMSPQHCRDLTAATAQIAQRISQGGLLKKRSLQEMVYQQGEASLPISLSAFTTSLARHHMMLLSTQSAGDLPYSARYYSTTRVASQCRRHLDRYHSGNSPDLFQYSLIFLLLNMQAVFLLVSIVSTKAQLNIQVQNLLLPHGELRSAAPVPSPVVFIGQAAVITKIILLILLVSVRSTLSVNTDARVDISAGAMSGVGGLNLPAKPVSSRRALPPEAESTLSRSGKRSYARAYARSCREGGAHFRGRWRPHTWFQPRHVPPQHVPKTTASSQPGPDSWKILTWNSGGLTAQVYQELQTYVRLHQYDLVLVQETKWSFDANWSTRDFHYVHCHGIQKEDRATGLLVMIAAKHAKADDIQFNIVHPGRILHVRLPVGQVHLDIITWYQYSSSTAEGVYERRHQLLVKLQKCLLALPQRNPLVFAGDFNCGMVSHQALCGPCVLPANPLQYKDLQDHQDVLRALPVCILNTWTRPKHGQLATFTFGSLASQIDYIVVRHRQANRVAKKAAILDKFPVAQWRQGGNHHPVVAYVPVPRRILAQARKTQPAFDRDRLLQDLRQPKAPTSLVQLREDIQASMPTPISHLNDLLLQVAVRHYPAPPRPSLPPDQPLELANSARHMWAIFREMRKQKFTMQGIATAWKLWVRFQRAHKAHKDRSRQRTKQKRDDLLQQAQEAADKGHYSGLWRIVKQMTPKVPRKRLQLHRNGHIISTTEEMDWILQAYGERYGTSAVDGGWQGPIGSDISVTIDASELRDQMLRIHPGKAVPRGKAAAILWKACAQQIATTVTEEVNHGWNQYPLPPQVDEGWSEATVSLLPKAHGRMQSPLDLRPIGLQDPLGKCVMTLLLRQARSAAETLIKQYPQTAYVQGRGTSTALRRVFAHCALVRAECGNDRLNPHQQRAGEQKKQCSGGLQLSLDMSAAFDLVRWDFLKEAMDFANIPICVQDILLVWLSQVRYIFHHRDCSGSLQPQWGLRQGCVASPILWSLFTSLMCASLDRKLGPRWSKEHATLYADDSHLKWRFETYVELERCMMEVRVALGVFKTFHMKVNYEKTKAILKVVGSLRSRVHKEYVRKHDQERRLLLSPRDPSAWVALVPQAEYLGLIISYGAFELQSMRHRIAKANKRRWAMASVLHSRRLSVGYKLQVWRSCVLSTLTYGLHCCGLSGDQLQEAQRHMMKHVRAVTNNQAHITGDSHATIMDKFGVQMMRTPDWMRDESWFHHVSERLSQQSEPEPEGIESAVWACPICEESFTTSAALKTHARRSHNIVDEHKEIFNKARHSKNGLPICKFCDRKFSKWQSLAVHINNNSCPVLIVSMVDHEDPDFANTPAEPPPVLSAEPAPPDQNTTLTICQLPEVLVAVQKGINAFIPLKAVTTQLLQTCAICGQWVASHRTLKRHYQYSHKDILDTLNTSIQKLVVRTATASPTTGGDISINVRWHGNVQSWCSWTRMFEDDELTEFFGELRENKPKRRRPEARDAHTSQQAAASQSTFGAGGLTLTSLARVVLRQDEEIRVIKQDHSLVLWLKAGADSIMPFLHRTAAHFKKKQEENPEWGPGWQPLRTVMALAMIRELANRLEATMKDETLLKTVTEKGWLDSQRKWRYQRWNPRLRCLEEDKDRAALTTEALVPLLEEIYAALKGETVTRFKCTRRLTETMESQAVFKMDISTRGEGIKAWNKMLELQGNSVWQLVGVAYRKESLKDSPAIQKLRDLLRPK
ncbi:unnamed protein product [Symbiodinium sp. CCMP2592]|nr:unnamed protein product [Symbiodinium sp. CCMP2592]